MNKEKYNASGCADPTAFEAIKNVEKDRQRVTKLINNIFYICDLAGFSIEGRIVLKDKNTDEVWR